MKRIYCILPCLLLLGLLGLLGLLALAGCMTLPGSGQPAAVQAPSATGSELAKIDAGAAWLDASVAKIMAAVKASTAQAPDVDTTALEPAVTALQALAASYGAAVAVGDVPKAEGTWPDARQAVTAAIEVAGKAFGPKLLTLLGG